MKTATQTRPAAKRSAIRGLLTTAAVFTTAIVIALIGTGTSYALWNGRATIDASTVSAGATGLTINDSAALALTGLDVTKLAPGQSVVAGLTVKNTGTTKLAVAIANTTATQTNGLADELTITITPVASTSACTPGLTGGMTARMAGFSTSAAPVTLAAGGVLPICLEVEMDTDAPVTVQNGSAAFTMNLSGNQVR